MEETGLTRRTNSNVSKASSQTESQKQHSESPQKGNDDENETKPSSMQTVRLAWAIHLLVGIAVVCCGIATNGGNRKYIPIDPTKIPNLNCRKAYVNVHASSSDEMGAIICCDDSSDHKWEWMSGSYEGLLCSPKPHFLPFANTLTTIREAWVLPLVPLLLRILTSFLSSKISTTTTTTTTTSAPSKNHHHYPKSSIRRLLTYILVMIFRGWGLYIFLNMIQDVFLRTTKPNPTITFPDDPCWYQHLLKPSKQHIHCYGREFDFSDHMVLFFGHTLPVILFELLFCFLVPSWEQPKERLHSEEEEMSASPKRKIWKIVPPTLWYLILIGLFLYFNFITFLAVHKTAAYFHTASEIAVGYVISLLVQIPLGCIICSEKWVKVRKFVGLPIGDRHDK